MERKLQIEILEAAMGQKISQMAKKYGLEIVVKAWEEMKMADVSSHIIIVINIFTRWYSDQLLKMT